MTAACEHLDLEPVIGFDGVHHADLCVDCLASLPRGYRCEDCDWTEDDADFMTFADAATGVVVRTRHRACRAHR